MNKKLTVLIFIEFYLPGYKAGGPIFSIANLTEALGDKFFFKIVTTDRDIGSQRAYRGIKTGSWQNGNNNTQIYYLQPEKNTVLHICRLIKKTSHDVLYLNSFFSWKYSIALILMRRLGLIPQKNVIVAPRGEFSSGALKIRKIKKNIYFYLSNLLGCYENVVFQASSLYELKDIRAMFKRMNMSGDESPVVVARDLSLTREKAEVENCSRQKKKGSLKIVFVSRISPMKNLDGALNMLHDLKGNVLFNIYGPMEDEVYWKNIKGVIDRLPSNIQVSYHGAIEHDYVIQAMSEHTLFFFPTYGENFGHVILEALISGCPILISDKTPWRGLVHRQVGWDFPLEKPEKFKEVLQKCVDMGNEEWEQLSANAKKYGRQKAMDKDVVQQNYELLTYKIN